MHDPSHVDVVGPLKPFAAGFADWLARHGYTPVSAKFQLYVMAHLSRWLTGEALDPRALSMVDVDQFLAARRRAGYTQYLSPKALQPLLASLREQGLCVRRRPCMARWTPRWTIIASTSFASVGSPPSRCVCMSTRSGHSS